MITNLRKVGQRLEYQEESLHFYPSILKGGIKVETANDHRLIMSLAVLASFLKEGLYFDSLEGVNKSYPNFFSDFTILGGKISVT
jgi:3-phosphoshikimate 1-carboxyvinyltransferase